MTTREEHLKWCKERASEYLENGNLKEAIISMMSDVGKHPETEGHIGIALGIQFSMMPDTMNYNSVKTYIEGFN